MNPYYTFVLILPIVVGCSSRQGPVENAPTEIMDQVDLPDVIEETIEPTNQNNSSGTPDTTTTNESNIKTLAKEQHYRDLAAGNWGPILSLNESSSQSSALVEKKINKGQTPEGSTTSQKKSPPPNTEPSDKSNYLPLSPDNQKDRDAVPQTDLKELPQVINKISSSQSNLVPSQQTLEDSTRQLASAEETEGQEEPQSDPKITDPTTSTEATTAAPTKENPPSSTEQMATMNNNEELVESETLNKPQPTNPYVLAILPMGAAGLYFALNGIKNARAKKLARIMNVDPNIDRNLE